MIEVSQKTVSNERGPSSTPLAPPCLNLGKPHGADLSGANLEGAVVDEDTIWPDGFDPAAAGVIFITPGR
ncbi:MAG: hypothetical protein QF419_02335 [Acidimicrobiales bacterium]|jgi:hypothetical protein|nr:hypothetical protein [Acidimicrobiales bacterium]